MPLNSPLDDIIGTVHMTDYELRRVLRNASDEAARIIRSLEGVTGPGARLREAQIGLAKVQVDAWANVHAATRVGIGDAVDASTDWMSRYDFEMMRASGLSITHWQQAMLAQSRAGIEAFISRQENKMTLSERVYRNRDLSRGHVERALNNGLLLGKSVAEIAKDVKGFINPDTPGGASYAAMRLARTEVVNAYHETAKSRYQQTPWVEKVKWNLSGSHPRPDTCNEYAEAQNFGRGEAGVWAADDVPSKPHPQCLCYITPVVMDLDTYAKNFKAGKYDDYIDKQMGCSVA